VQRNFCLKTGWQKRVLTTLSQLHKLTSLRQVFVRDFPSSPADLLTQDWT